MGKGKKRQSRKGNGLDRKRKKGGGEELRMSGIY